MNAPERIWAYAGTFKMWRDHKTDAPHKQTEYIRADINAELLEALDEVRADCIARADKNGVVPIGRSAWMQLETVIARAKGGTQ